MAERIPMTVSGAARALRRAESTVRRWADDGRLRIVRTERGLRLFDRKSVEELARQLEQERRAQ